MSQGDKPGYKLGRGNVRQVRKADRLRLQIAELIERAREPRREMEGLRPRDEDRRLFTREAVHSLVVVEEELSGVRTLVNGIAEGRR